MVKEYQRENEGECFFCSKEIRLACTFPCNHLICAICLYRHIFCFHINEIHNSDKISVKCKCSNPGFIDLDMVQLHDLMANLEENEEESGETCKFHNQNNNLDYFCKDCNKKICRTCYDNPKGQHYGHRVESKRMLARKMKDYLLDFKLTILPEEVYQQKISQFSDKIKQIAEIKFKETMQSLKAVIESLQSFHREYVQNYKKEMERIVYNLKILHLFYSRFYSDLKDIDIGDIYFLKYINNSKCFFVHLDINQMPNIDQTLSNIKVQVEDLKKVSTYLKTGFNFEDIPKQFRLVNIIPKAHKSLIKSIIQLSDDRLVTGSEDQTLRIWEETEKGYENNIKVDRYVGVVNTLLSLKQKRFASAGKNKEIKIWLVGKECSCKQSLLGHNDDITSLASLKDGRMISGAKDFTFIIWHEQKNQFEQIQLFNENDKIYNIIPLYDSRIVISTESNINLWKEGNKKFELAYTFPKNNKGLIKTICQLKDGKLAIGGQSKVLYIWEESEVNVFSLKQESTEGHNSDINAIIELNDGNLASGSRDRIIYIWKKNFNRLYVIIEKIIQYEHGIYCVIQLKDGRLCTATSTDCIVLYKDRSDYY